MIGHPTVAPRSAVGQTERRVVRSSCSSKPAREHTAARPRPGVRDATRICTARRRVGRSSGRPGRGPAPAVAPHRRSRSGRIPVVELSDGTKARVKLLDVEEDRDGVRSAIREARVKLEVNGQAATLVPADLSPAADRRRRPDRLSGDQGLLSELRPVRGFLGPGEGRPATALAGGLALVAPGTFVYPAQASLVRRRDADGERAVVRRWRRRPDRTADLLPLRHGHRRLRGPGGRGLRDATAWSSRREARPCPSTPTSRSTSARTTTTSTSSTPRAGSIATAHLQVHRPGHPTGERVKMGQKIGVLGKEGSSGGWSHLHFDIKARQPSGKWGIQEAYAFLWEAYLREHKPRLVAVARPHHLIRAGEKVVLDGSRPGARRGRSIATSGPLATGPPRPGAGGQRTYEQARGIQRGPQGRRRPGSGGLRLRDRAGHRQGAEGKLPPTIHASYAPTFGIRPGDPVTFKLRTFFADPRGRRGTSATGARPCRFGRTGRPAQGRGRLRRDDPPLRRSRGTTSSGSSGRTRAGPRRSRLLVRGGRRTGTNARRRPRTLTGARGGGGEVNRWAE